jgi:DNA-binding beta-propeller fold protein YncE
MKHITVFLLFFLFSFSNAEAQKPKLYWTHNGVGIVSANLDGSDQKVLIPIRNIAHDLPTLDSVGRKIYWADSNKKIIGRFNLDGSGEEVLIKTGSAVSAMSIDYIRKKICWLEAGIQKVYEANLDGSAPGIFLNTIPSGAQPLTIDYVNKKLYWINLSGTALKRSNYDGSGTEDMATSTTQSRIWTFQIDAQNNKLFWVQGEEVMQHTHISRVFSKNMDGTGAKEVLNQTYAMAPGVTDLCLDPKGKKIYVIGWPHLRRYHFSICAYEGGSYQVISQPFEHYSRAGNLSFDPKNNALYFIGGTPCGIYRMGVLFSGASVTTNFNRLTNYDIAAPDGIAVDQAGGKLYWTDPGNSTIKRANLDGSNLETLMAYPVVVHPGGLALDLTEKKMYWTDRSTEAVMRANLDGSAPKALLWANYNLFATFPVSIALDVSAPKMYISCEGPYGLRRANLEGTQSEHLFYTDIQAPYKFALDLDNRKIYFPQIFVGLMRANFDGTELDTVVETKSNIGGIALDLTNQKIYWIKDSVLQRIDFDGTNPVNLTSGLPRVGYYGHMTWGATHAYRSGEISVGVKTPPGWQADVRVAPNPFDGALRFASDAFSGAPVRYRMEDMAGREVCGGWSQNGAINDLSHLESGFYILRLFDSGRSAAVKVLKTGR